MSREFGLVAPDGKQGIRWTSVDALREHALRILKLSPGYVADCSVRDLIAAFEAQGWTQWAVEWEPR